MNTMKPLLKVSLCLMMLMTAEESNTKERESIAFVQEAVTEENEINIETVVHCVGTVEQDVVEPEETASEQAEATLEHHEATIESLIVLDDVDDTI